MCCVLNKVKGVNYKMDKLDNELERIFSKDINVPNKCRNALKNALYTKETSKNSKYAFFKTFATLCVGIILISSVVVATNYNKIINYFGLGNGIDTAVENGYIEETNMNYVTSFSTLEDGEKAIILSNTKTNVKIDNFLMDDLNLSVNFDFEFDETINETVNFNNIRNIELRDLIITDEENRIIYSKATKEVFDEYCKKNDLPYIFGEFNENYMNNGLNSFIKYRDQATNQINLIYNMYADGYPKSKTLKFSFSEILITEIDKEEIEKNTILVGEWNIIVEIPEKMYKRQTIPYRVVSCSNEDFKITTAFATDTGFEIGIIINNMEKPEYYLQLLDEEIKKEIDEGKITEAEAEERGNELLKTTKYKTLMSEWRPIEDTPIAELGIENIEATSYLENEKGKKFEKSLSPTRRQDANFIDGNRFSYYETFKLTKYEITNKLKVQIMFKGEPIVIELEKY